MISICIFPSMGQTAFHSAETATARPATFSDQEFHCHTGYSLQRCQQDIGRLKSILSHYPIQALGHWTWVLVRSEDWKLISQSLQLNPDSPAFSALEPRETFLDEGLFVHDAERTAELMHEWQRSMPELLELAVSHELGHALCADANEAAAKRFGEELRNGLTPRCTVSKRKDKGTKTVVAGEAQGSRPNISRVP